MPKQEAANNKYNSDNMPKQEAANNNIMKIIYQNKRQQIIL